MDITEPPASAQTQVAAPGTEQLPPDLALGPFILQQPPPLSPEEASQLGKGTIERIFTMVTTLEQPSKTAKESSQSVGFGRLAASSFDRDSWLSLLTRLATRASVGLDSNAANEETKYENDARGAIMPAQSLNLADRIREVLYRYVVEDFRVRINSALSWLNEEWYNDQMQVKQSIAEHGTDLDTMTAPKHYDHWVMRILEGILPYLDARDKVLIRFLSEIPQITPALIEKVKTLANDPERVNLCVQAFQ